MLVSRKKMIAIRYIAAAALAALAAGCCPGGYCYLAPGERPPTLDKTRKEFADLFGPEPRKRLAAVERLAAGTEKSLMAGEALAEVALADDEEQVRRRAAAAVCGADNWTYHAVERFVRELEISDRRTRLAAAQALAFCAGQAAEAGGAFGALAVTASEDPDPEVRRAARRSLRRLKSSLRPSR